MTPEASRYFRWGTQKRRLYDRLACGPATAADIVRELHIYQYQKIINEIRSALEGTGVTVKARPVNGRRNLWEYRLGLVDSPGPEQYGGQPRCEMVTRYDAASAGGGCQL
jgi:hypothetical protein